MKSVLLILFSLFLFSPNSIAETLTFEHYFELGNSYTKKKDWDNAIDAYLRAIKINDESAVANFYLGWAYFYKMLEVRDKNMEKEIAEISLKSNDQPGVLSGEDEVTRELEAKKVQQWKRTIELDDLISGAHYMLGTHYYNINNLSEAERELKRAIELDPKYDNSYGVLASVYEKMGKNDLAIDFHLKQLSLDPDYDFGRTELIMLYHKLGMKKEAIEHYNILKNKKSDSINSFKYILGPNNYLDNQAVHQTE